MFIVPLTEMQSINSLDGVSKIKPSLINTDNNTDKEESFADTLKSAINGVKELEMKSQQDSYDLAMGKTDDIEGIMIQSAKATTAIEITTQIVTRAVNTYKEIIQMQI
ncbi:MAG: flagellar hook-basal body complex protein FliE [Clostridiales bacterium]|nr:flagellar hook-basal body complex protein FliE [Clostridiales bacterium]